MRTILPEMKVLFEMALNGATFREIYESSEYNYLEMIMGEMNTSLYSPLVISAILFTPSSLHFKDLKTCDALDSLISSSTRLIYANA